MTQIFGVKVDAKNRFGKKSKNLQVSLSKELKYLEVKYTNSGL